MVGIYKIISPTGKVYIGQSWNLKQRVYTYKKLKCLRQPKLYNSLAKYGWINHLFEVIHTLPQDTTQEILNYYEIFYWQECVSREIDMLNVKEPGSNGKHSQASKQKIADSKRGKKRSIETKEKVSKALKGREVSKEAIAKRIETRNQIGTNKIQSERMFGIRQQQDTIEKRKETRKKSGLGKKKILHIESGIVYPSRKEAAIALQTSPSTISSRMQKGLFQYI